MIYDRAEFDLRLEWGMKGVEQLSPVSDVVIIVDTLSFSTCVDIATANGARVYPYQWKDKTAAAYAKSMNAELAAVDRNSSGGFSLSPASLCHIKSGTSLVLPSPPMVHPYRFRREKPLPCATVCAMPKPLQGMR